MSKPSAKVIALDSRNVRGRARRWQNKPADPTFLLAAAMVHCLIVFGLGFLVGILAAHVPLSAVAQ